MINCSTLPQGYPGSPPWLLKVQGATVNHHGESPPEAGPGEDLGVCWGLKRHSPRSVTHRGLRSDSCLTSPRHGAAICGERAAQPCPWAHGPRRAWETSVSVLALQGAGTLQMFIEQGEAAQEEPVRSPTCGYTACWPLFRRSDESKPK